MLHRARAGTVGLMLGFAAAVSGFAATEMRDVSAGMLAYEAGEFARALAIFLPLVEGGDPSAQFMVGAMYFYGRGLDRDDGSAAIMFHKAAAQGNPEGMLAFGSLLLYGVGLRQDIVKSYMWLRIAGESQNFYVAQQAKALLLHAAKLMTPREISQAESQARDFRPRKPRFAS